MVSKYTSVSEENDSQYKTALVVEGGAMRSVFSAGILDGFLSRQFNPFDFYIGVSAGAYNLTTYLAGRSGASLKTMIEFGLNKKFISYMRFIRGGHLLDLDWIFKVALMKLDLDFDAIYQYEKQFYICVADVDTGDAVYINTNKHNIISTMKASTALPLIYREFPKIDNRAMTDGGVADPMPVAKAIELGAKRIMVIRARPKTYIKKDSLGHRLTRWKLRRYKNLNETMRERIKRHEDTINLIRNPPAGVDIVEIRPPDNFTMGRFSRSKECLTQGYETGLDYADDVIELWNKKDENRSQSKACRL